MVKALIVEDEAFVALDLQSVLENLGYEVVDICVSAEDGLQKVAQHSPDLILVDVSLAGAMNGVEMVEQIRQDFDMPVVYITAYSDDATITPMKNTEPFEYLLKPFNEQVLRVTIEFALHKASARSEQLASGRLLSTTLQSIGDAVITTDEKGSIQFLNPIAEGLTGWSFDDAVGLPLGEVFSILNEQTREPAFDPVKAVLETGKSSQLANNTLLISKDGSEYPIEDSAAPIADADGTIYGVVLVFRDVTKRQYTEMLLRQAQKLDSLGLLASGIAHDFNNILATITVNTSLLKSKELQSPQNIRLIDRIQRASKQAAELTEQLLTYAGGSPSSATVVELNEIVESTLDLVTPSKPDVAGINKNLGDGSLPILAERSQIQQVVLNLVLNGFDAISSQEREGILSLHSQRLFIEQDLLLRYLSKAPLSEGEYVQLAIHDTGGGIEPALIEKIFDPFFSTKPTGSGLGLAATLGIIYHCNGGIAVDSVIGVGTTFTIIFPSPHSSDGVKLEGTETSASKDDGADQSSEDVSNASQRNDGSYVLVADDQPDILDALDDILVSEGFRTLLASDGTEALETYHQYASRISLVVLDIRMPKMNGTSALIAMLRDNPKLKAILMTGHAHLDTIKSYQQHLSNIPVIQKPFSYEQIVEHIQNILEPASGTST